MERLDARHQREWVYYHQMKLAEELLPGDGWEVGTVHRLLFTARRAMPELRL